jgi:hypothetical protein
MAMTENETTRDERLRRLAGRRPGRHAAARARVVAASVSTAGFVAIFANLASQPTSYAATSPVVTPEATEPVEAEASAEVEVVYTIATTAPMRATTDDTSSEPVVVEANHRVSEVEVRGNGVVTTSTTPASTQAPKPPACTGSTC